jgi:V-type H+-transporting ATPase subunit a
VGVWLCLKGKKLLDMPSGEILYWVRFLVLQLGIYATFAGLLYNDMFSVGLQLFDTRFSVDADGKYSPTWDHKNEGNGKGGPYPFGVDWAWHGATNELMFMNSLKMKLSVLFGVIQMTLGVFLRFGNALYFKSKIDFWCECVPMLIFMVCFFGWMDFMILYKWVNWIDTENGPPGIINSLICMAMGPMGVGQEDLFPLWTGSFTSVQLSTMLMNLSVISVPWLLIFKPILLKRAYNAEQASGKSVAPDDEESGGHGHGHGGHGHGEEGFNMGEILIHQIIETIEYVLGTVSHTASYLRIWALSLAHQQLSLVFYSKTIGMALPMSFPTNGIVLYIMFCVWFAITAAVLLGMDVLECFLHTLRLHWVEFDSKFFKADGYAFEPYSIRGCVSQATE